MGFGDGWRGRIGRRLPSIAPNAAALALALCACGDNADPASAHAPPDASECADASERVGQRVCVHSVPDRDVWEEISFELAAIDQARATTYLVPATDGAGLPTLFVDARAFDMPEQSLHYKFLSETFDEFALLSYEEYLELTLDPERRQFFAGNLTEYVAPGQSPLFGFTVWDRGTDPAATVSCAQLEQVYEALDARATALALRVVPANDLQRETLTECDLPVHDPALALDYESYHRARGCGTLRRLTLAELADAEAQAELGFQDVLVLDEAPLDIETVVAGVLTGTRQGELSHLNVRSASRGTPNCYLKDAYAAAARWEGKLVELECGPAGVTILEISAADAKGCADAIKPEPAAIVEADLAWSELSPLLELPTDTAEQRRAAVGRYGSKGANLATLYQRIDAELQLAGFLVPLHGYDAYVTARQWMVDLGDGPALHTFRETLDRWLAQPEFRADPSVRRGKLEALRAAMRDGVCDAQLLEDISAQILATQESATTMVRFRSSSNAEDALGFNGAGLYDSTSVCLADDTDDDAEGPSACDADQPKERGLCRGLKKVWASLWNMKAFEEREWYGIDHTRVAMGVLVNTRTKGELANIVAFTGNPLLRGDDRFLINAQEGELDVVSAVAGVWPEKDLLTLRDKMVSEIERAKGSTELPEGQWVLDDAVLEQLGAALATIAEVYPIDEAVPRTAHVLLDTEWKLRADGRLVIKQVRPFLE